jgi:NADPH:quinone reductase-like Zn-dependent oxidoreductase
VQTSSHHVGPAPDQLDGPQSAVVPLAGVTAWQIANRLPLGADDWVLVFGAAGGVGQMLTQLGARRGWRIAAVTSARDEETALAGGAALWLDRSGDAASELVRRVGRPSAAVVDLVGGQLVQALPHVVEGGHAVSITTIVGDIDEVVDRNLTLHGVLVKPGREGLDALGSEVARGLRPRLRKVLPLADADQAHALVSKGGIAGKVALSTSFQ